MGFAYALLLIGLALALASPSGAPVLPVTMYLPPFNWLSSWTQGESVFLAYWLKYSVAVAHILLAVWALGRAESAAGVSKRAVAALFAMAVAAMLVSMSWSGWVVFEHYRAFDAMNPAQTAAYDGFVRFVYWVVEYAIIIAISYRYEFLAGRVVRRVSSALRRRRRGLDELSTGATD